MMAQIKIDSDNKVIAIYYLADEREGWIQVDSIPDPELIAGKVPVMFYRNGAIEYEYEDLPPTPEPEPIPEPEPSYEEQVEALIAERYTVKNEIALLRQQNRKPEEFKAYDDYCEACKAKVKQKLGMV